MELHFVGEDEVPRPPEETRFRWVKAEPDRDGRRVRIEFELSPFQRRPDIEIAVQDAAGASVAGTSIIETVEARMGVTLHLRGAGTGLYRASLTLSYPDLGPRDERELTFEIE